MQINDDTYYALEGRTLKRLFEIASRFNDGQAFHAFERRDLAQELRAKLELACPLDI
jgi:hypothetical protein